MRAPRGTWVVLAACMLLFTARQLVLQPRVLVQAGVLAYQNEDFATAVKKFEQALSPRPPSSQAGFATLQRNLSLAALRAEDLERAAFAADELATSGRRSDLAWRDFFMGNLAWRRSELAEIEAHGPVPPAGAMERAIGFAEAAQEAWGVALEAQGEWPEAQRNLTRVAERLSILRAELQASAGVGNPEIEKMAAPPDMTAAPLDPAEQERLLQQLERLDMQNAARKAEQQTQQGGYEW